MRFLGPSFWKDPCHILSSCSIPSIGFAHLCAPGFDCGTNEFQIVQLEGSEAHWASPLCSQAVGNPFPGRATTRKSVGISLLKQTLWLQSFKVQSGDDTTKLYLRPARHISISTPSKALEEPMYTCGSLLISLESIGTRNTHFNWRGALPMIVS